ncbi:hypothetical protein ACFYSF_47635 [Streptomyces canus]|uniref:hypothetical protein n=1 Tax=Streptomyces canus TaxID=58343 RepID=UPI0036784FE7
MGTRNIPIRTGVCQVRAEAQRSGLHLTLLLVPDISRTSTGRTLTLSEIDAAVAAVREFLTEFAAAERSVHE